MNSRRPSWRLDKRAAEAESAKRVVPGSACDDCHSVPGLLPGPLQTSRICSDTARISKPPASTESTDELSRRPFLATGAPVLKTINEYLGLQATTGDLSKASAKLGFSYPAGSPG